MNLWKGGLVIMLSGFVGTAVAGPFNGSEVEERQGETAGSSRAVQYPELMDAVRAIRQLAAQSQDELKRSREQNERLQKTLEQTRQELIRLREEVSLLRERVLSGQSTVPPSASPELKGQAAGKTSPTPAAAEDLAARVTRIEDQVELNTAQIKEHAQTKVGTDSRFRMTLFGMVLNNTYFNTSDSSGNAVPVVAPPTTAPATGGNFGSTLRQTQFGFSMTGPKLGEARLSADAEFDFFGGTAGTYGSDVLGALRMRTASARLDGQRTSLAIGLMSPLISPLNPTSLAAVYYPALGESGNLWQWRPQVTVERRTRIGEDDDLILQGGLMMPFGDTVNGTQLKGKPGYEMRVALTRGSDAERRLQIGFGGYFYPQLLGYGRTVDSQAVTSDWQIPLTRRFALSGEAFYGQSITLGEQSGENIADAFALSGSLGNPLTTVRGVHSAGGWAQFSAKATARLEFNTAFGIADPRNRDIFAGLFDQTTVLKNQTFSANSIFHLRSDFAVALEYRHLWTTYPDAQTTNNHLNLAIGYFF